MDIIEPAFSRISLNELYEQPIISARREHNTHANNVPPHFFDVKAPVTCCANRYCFAEHTNRYIWLTEHRCCHRLAQPMRNWIEDVLCMQNNTIPILENPLHTTANEIRDKLLEGCFDLNGFDKVQVNVRAGHLFSLCEQVDGSIEITEEERGFSQQWPLFVDVTIYAQEATFPSNTCQVLITVGKCGSGGQVHPEPYVLLQEIATTPRHHYGGMGGIAVA